MTGGKGGLAAESSFNNDMSEHLQLRDTHGVARLSAVVSGKPAGERRPARFHAPCPLRALPPSRDAPFPGVYAGGVGVRLQFQAWRTGRRAGVDDPGRGRPQRAALYPALGLGFPLQDARGRTPADSELLPAGRFDRAAGVDPGRHGAFCRGAVADGPLRLPARPPVGSVQEPSRTQLRRDVAGFARGAHQCRSLSPRTGRRSSFGC